MYDFIPDIICSAAKIMLSAHDIDSTVIAKEGSANFVTRFDVAVEEFLTEKLLSAMPDAVVIGEESDDNHTELLGSRISIIMDPIDGTTNFIHNYRYSAISVGICDKGEMVYGAVLDPYAGRLYHAEKGCGAFVRDTSNGVDYAIAVSERSLVESLLGFGTSPYYREELGKNTFDAVYTLFGICRDVRRSGSAALDLCNVAAGALDVFFEYRLSPWDYAAASLIIKEAGGVITQIDGTEITLDASCSVTAGNMKAHRELLDRKIL